MRHRFAVIVALLSFVLLGCTEEIPGKIEGVVSRGESPSFFTFGDWGANTEPQRKVAEAVRTVCEKEHCDFGVLLGDNFYPGGVKSTTDPTWKANYLDIYEKLTMPFYVALGNHDYGGDIYAQIHYRDPKDRWHMPARFYQFTVGDAAFFAIDTTRWTPNQLLWLKKELAEAADVKWKIVFGHHPVFSYGQHGDTPYLVKDLLPVLKEGKVNLYLAGHDHHQELLREGNSGPIYVLSGGGGAEIRPVQKGDRALFAKSRYGAVHLSLAAGAAKIKYFDDDGKVDFEYVLEGPAPKAKDAPMEGDESARVPKRGRSARKPGAVPVPR